MAGNVYLKTNRFKVKLEGITFKLRDFEYLCAMDFLSLEGKVWHSPPVVGLDVMRHPRDPSILLVLLSFGIGCVILRFGDGKPLPATIQKFLSDKRIHFVSYGIPEKKDLFPFEELGLTRNKVDIGYIAAKVLKETKCKTWELAELARKVLGIKRMIGMTHASSLERHEQIKCAICKLFITSIVAMILLQVNGKKKLDGSNKKSSFLKNLNSLHPLAEGWFKLPKGKKETHINEVDGEEDSICVNIGEMEAMINDDLSSLGDAEDDSSHAKVKDLVLGHGVAYDKDTRDDDNRKDASCTAKVPLKGILKCPSRKISQHDKMFPSEPASPSTEKSQITIQAALKRANYKGCNVSFKCE